MTQSVASTPPPPEKESAQAFIRAFAQEYGDAYLRLAYHAAFPLALTSDLLYRLWGTLCHDDAGAEPIPYGAVAKLLLGTGLCRTVGSNLYQIDPGRRQALLQSLAADPRFGESRLQDLAAFTLSYAEQQQHHPDPMVRDFAQVQRWGALAYCQAPQAAQELAQALAHAYAVDRDDLYRIAKIVLTLADPLKDYPTLLSYARSMERLACGDEAGAPPPPPSAPAEPLPPDFERALAPLRASLQQGDWRLADSQTDNLLLAIGDKDKNGWLNREEVEQLSCAVLRAIDREWVRESNGRFGFSVQAQIWREVGSPDAYATDDVTLEKWQMFADRVGWRVNNEWLNYDQLKGNPSSSPAGEFPTVGAVVVAAGFGLAGFGWGRSPFPSLYVNCSTSQF